MEKYTVVVTWAIQQEISGDLINFLTCEKTKKVYTSLEEARKAGRREFFSRKDTVNGLDTETRNGFCIKNEQGETLEHWKYFQCSETFKILQVLKGYQLYIIISIQCIIDIFLCIYKK